jgi:hypothetical protein
MTDEEFVALFEEVREDVWQGKQGQQGQQS